MLHLETLLASAGCVPDAGTGALVAPPVLSSTFERAADGSYPNGYQYGRAGNPTRALFEKTLARLEGGTACAAFASGMAAASAVFQALRPGAHVLLADDVYYGVRTLLDDVFVRWELSYESVDLTDLDALEKALAAGEKEKLVWAETPSNPMLKITDLAAVAECADAAGARLVVDATWTTPLLQRPFDSGADLVLHSVTKYLGGHSDLIGGAVVAQEENSFFARIQTVQEKGGAVMDPFSAWLALRGMRSLGARMRLQCANARRVAAFLDGHPRVRRVHFPGLETHPGYAVAQRQMEDFGAMLAFEVAGGADEAMAVAARCRIFTRATSLGGTESLIEHRASVEPPSSATPDALLRLSIGVERTEDLLADLSQALND